MTITVIEEARGAKEYFDKLKMRKPGQEANKVNFELSEGFKNALNFIYFKFK